MIAPAILLALALGGCASWGAAGLVERGDRLALAGDLAGALRAYDDALAHGVNGSTETRARAGRTTAAAALAARDEIQGVRDELARRESELARLRADVAARTAEVQKLSRDLSARDGELSRARQDLTRLAGEAEQLRASIEDLKRLEIRLERRPR